MISPLGQRQMFQTVNAEAVRAALEGSGQLQREAMNKQIIMAQMAEDQASVLVIPHAEAPRTEERRGGGQGEGHRGSSGEPGDPDADSETGSVPAKPAEGHLDFLA
jgi:hypothetical protein